MRSYGGVDVGLPHRIIADTFWGHVDKSAACWMWLGGQTKGYGTYSTTMAHRVAYLLCVGPIPDGLELDHLCYTPLCVNPSHLEPVTRTENIRRRIAAGPPRPPAPLRTHCTKGHEFTPENTIPRDGGGRGQRCRICKNDSRRDTRRRRRMAAESL